jgi:hypothetical protein
MIGSPASSPKPLEKSPGWKTGQQRQRKIQCPIVKKQLLGTENKLLNQLSIHFLLIFWRKFILPSIARSFFMS